MNHKEILDIIREEISPFTCLRYLPEDNKLFLGLFASELGMDALDLVELSMKLEKRFGIDGLDFSESVRVQDILDSIVQKTNSDEGSALGSAALYYCYYTEELAAFKKGWEAAIKWYKENQI